METLQPAQPERLTITAAHAGQRLDRVLADWRGLSRSAVLRILDTGAVLLNNSMMSRKDKGRLMSVGDVVTIDGQYVGDERPMPDADMPLSVLAQGAGWLVVDKPAGVAVRPHALDETGTMINAVIARHPQLAGVGEGGLRSGVVHRLDNDTSGALLVALDQQAWLRLRQAFAQHNVIKHYEAIVHGHPPEAGSSELRLRVAQHAPARVEVCTQSLAHPDARDCSLSWRVRERLGKHASHIEVQLHTGFLHQVRVMMSYLGYPVVGDKLYGNTRQADHAPRQMLHAKSLAYEEVDAQSPLPADFVRQIASIRG